MDTRNGDIYANRALAEAAGVNDEDLVTGSQSALEKLRKKLVFFEGLVQAGDVREEPIEVREETEATLMVMAECHTCGELFTAEGFDELIATVIDHESNVHVGTVTVDGQRFELTGEELATREQLIEDGMEPVEAHAFVAELARLRKVRGVMAKP